MQSLARIKKTHGPTTVALLKKQCSIINVDYKKINFAKSNWYQDYMWTKKQEDQFRKYFIAYLYGNLKRTKEIANFARVVYKDKKRLMAVWCFWNLDYGWKRRDDETEKRQGAV